jgi:hypothetical protein
MPNAETHDSSRQQSYHVAPYRCSLSPRQAASLPRKLRVILQRYDATAYHVAVNEILLRPTDQAV